MGKSKNILLFALILWFFVAFVYIQHTPFDHRTHDLWGQVLYTEFLVIKNKFPRPYELQHSYHPPLYYLINSFIEPGAFRTSFEAVVGNHIRTVRYLSVIYGALALAAIWLILQEINLSPFLQFLVLMFIATTPKFVFIFSTYNNDSLSIVASIAVIVLSYKLYKKGSKKTALWLLGFSTIALYSKYSSMLCIGSIFLICLKNLLKRKSPVQEHKRVLGILALSFALLFPWAYYHNFYNAGRLFPTNQDGQKVNLHPTLAHKINVLSSVVKIPILQYSQGEWSKPWTYPTLDHPPEKIHVASKTRDFFSYSFVTSIIGEFNFISPDEIFIWAVLGIHLLVSVFGIIQVLSSNITKLAGALILLSYLSHLYIISKSNIPVWACAMDYRYISWNWICWAVLYGSALLQGRKFIFLKILILILGIIAQLYILMTVEGQIGSYDGHAFKQPGD